MVQFYSALNNDQPNGPLRAGGQPVRTVSTSRAGWIRRSGIGVGVAAITTVVILASVAWACTPQSTIYPLTPGAAPPREKVTVAGELLQPGPAEVRWNSLDGPKLAVVERANADQTFSVEATLPDAAPGVYYLLLVSGEKGVARAAVEVTDPDATVRVAAPDAFNVGLDSATPSSAQSSRGMLLAGVGLLGVGLVALSGLALVAPRRKKRATVER